MGSKKHIVYYGVCVCVCVCCDSIFENYFQQDRKHFCFKTILDIMKP